MAEKMPLGKWESLAEWIHRLRHNYPVLGERQPLVEFGTFMYIQNMRQYWLELFVYETVLLGLLHSIRETVLFGIFTSST